MYVKKNRQMPDEDAFKLNSTLRPKAPPWHHQEGPHLCDYEKKFTGFFGWYSNPTLGYLANFGLLLFWGLSG